MEKLEETEEETIAEVGRLSEDKDRKKNWKRWGPYLSERQWGTVREDYSKDGDCWNYFPHDVARSKVYRWGEDGLLGLTDRQCRLCFAVVLWNGKDPILKERLFGLTGPQGNHGEDVKECYYYLDSTPTHSYMKALYKYPQREFPYKHLEEENGRRNKLQLEYELEDTGIFEDSNYWDVTAEYAKASPNDVLMKITVSNRSSEQATIHVLPTLWFRNTWIWGCKHEGCTLKPKMMEKEGSIQCTHQYFNKFFWKVDEAPQYLFTENETNTLRLYNTENYTPYVKDAFHRYVIHGDQDAVSPRNRGTKVAAYFCVQVEPGQSKEIRCRLWQEGEDIGQVFGRNFEQILETRKNEADQFYNHILNDRLTPDESNVARQALASLLWSKQFYHYIVKDWLGGDTFQPPPPEQRKGRNTDWYHLFNKDVVSMPDKWEYPWYASWDLAFHMVPFCLVDIEFAKQQLLLFLREWYMHPNGQIPAYEFAFGDVNPPVHAWAVLRVYKATGVRGQRDKEFLARCFQKLVINFTWWVNRKDPQGNNIFSGGFLGLDNIGPFDRSKPLPCAGQLEQADGTAWMAFFCVTMLEMAMELAETDPVYEDMASKFFEHMPLITEAINDFGQGKGLWNEEDGFYYDCIRTDSGESVPVRVRSMVGLVPLFACLVMEEKEIEKLEEFFKRARWFYENRPDMFKSTRLVTSADDSGARMLLSIPTEEQLLRILDYLLDEQEFLSPFGIRSLSKWHQEHPCVIRLGDEQYEVKYVPGESDTHLFGGNSNWRGPVWLCMNLLVIESLQRYYYYYGDSLKVECPKGSGNIMNLDEVSKELATRVSNLFLPNQEGYRPCHGNSNLYAKDKFWKDLVLFYEYFDGETGRGCGASHQTGWTAVVVNCLMVKLGEKHLGMRISSTY